MNIDDHEKEIDALVHRMVLEYIAKEFPMSTGENINANGAYLTQDMIRAGFHRFPQTVLAKVGPALWPQVKALQIAPDYPFKAALAAGIPFGEVWFVDVAGTQLGRIVNVHISVGPTAVGMVTQDDALDFVDDESNETKVKRQRDRRIKDALL